MNARLPIASVDATSATSHALPAGHAAHQARIPAPDEAEGKGLVKIASLVAYAVILVGCMLWRMVR